MLELQGEQIFQWRFAVTLSAFHTSIIIPILPAEEMAYRVDWGFVIKRFARYFCYFPSQCLSVDNSLTPLVLQAFLFPGSAFRKLFVVSEFHPKYPLAAPDILLSSSAHSLFVPPTRVFFASLER